MELTSPLPPPPPPAPPRWEFLLSHHLPPRWNRTLAVGIGAHRVHLCTRCTGLALGALLLVGLYVLSLRVPFPFTAPGIQLPFSLAPLLAAWDWSTQSEGRRESTTPLRLVSGTLLGLAYADALGLLLLRQWLEVAIAALIFVMYALAVVAALQRSGSLQRVVAEHFPGAA